MSRLPRWLRLVGAVCVFLLLLGVVFVVAPLYRSLPRTAGSGTLATLDAVVAVQRDRDGVVTIQAEGGRRDVARTLGWVHGQERFFQMDLMRRLAAGELAELFGHVALPADRKHRLHRLRDVARAALARLPEDQRRLLEDYAFGVNAGRDDLGEFPFEYLLLRSTPAEWKAEDCLLVVAAMALQLQDVDGQPDRARGTIREVFAPEVAAFFLSGADAFEAPLDDTTRPLPAVPAAPALRSDAPAPGAATARPSRDAADPFLAALLPRLRGDADLAPGSNAWAISGKHTQGLGTILASDVHLGLGVPNVWFRVRLKWLGVDRKMRDVTGASLPGVPALPLGTNGAVAWAVTNAYIDTSDVVVVETDPADATRYRTPDGWKNFEPVRETLAVRGAAEETLAGRATIWGPVIGTDHAGRPLALKWVMHDPAAYNFDLLGLEECGSVRGALAFAKTAGMPHQNFVCSDRHGDIAWTIAGRIPKRTGTDGFVPVSWADGAVKWDGWLPMAEHPQVINPPAGRIWSANARMLGGAALARLGDGGYSLASRAVQIRDELLAKEEFTPADAFRLQLDVRGRHLERWQQLLLDLLSAENTAASPARGELRALVDHWGGRAVPESAGYRLVREFRRHARARIAAAVFAPCVARDPGFKSGPLGLEEPLFALAKQQPVGWLPHGRAGWTELLLAAADDTIADAGGAGKLAQFTWGGANRLAMRHPLAGAIPVLGGLLDMKSRPMAGDDHVVNALTAAHGPSERMVASPGREAESFFHMPGGQSGNPLSSHYSAGHDAWLEGRPAPLLPGSLEEHLALFPAKR